MHQVTIEEAQKSLPQLVQEAIEGGDIVITVANRPVLRLESYVPNRQPGSAKGQVWMSEDFDEPSDEFKEYM